VKTINVEEINLRMEKFTKDRDWEQFHSIKNLVMALNVESSELLEIFQWMKEEDSNLVSRDHMVKEKIGEEIADIFMYLASIAKKAEIDIEAAVLSKMQKNELKYPVEKAKGNSKKYTEF
jgi:NTP pyrophosphatase (non-canonical NTP hydrolase)